MTDVIDFAFECLGFIWNLIIENYILSVSFIILIVGFIITLVNGSTGNN